VAAFGLGHKFVRIVDIVFRHARHNPYRFVMTGAAREPEDYDLALVDMTTQGGPEVAQALRRQGVPRPVVTVGRRGDPARPTDDLLMQRFAPNLLSVLNGAVERHLLLPMQRGAAAVVRGASSLLTPPDPEQLLGRRPRVLMVDESPAVRRQLSLALHQMGLDSEGVGSGCEARDVIAVRRYELMFVEAVLPDVAGLKLARDVKRDPALRGMPVIVLTRRSSPLDLLRGAMSGCDSYLVKPVTLQTLRETVNRCLRKSLQASTRLGSAPAG
jgi:CheY-like chemotaxis protein